MKKNNYILIIKELLSQKKLRQEDLALLIKKTPTTINNYLTGKSKIDIETFIEIAEALNVPVSFFFEETTQGETKSIIQNGHFSGNQNSKVIIASKNAEAQNYISEIEKLNIKIEGLLKEIEGVKRENLLLKEINELLKKS